MLAEVEKELKKAGGGRRGRRELMNGILVVDKPAGWTSFDVIAKLRGVLATRKLGHSGHAGPYGHRRSAGLCGDGRQGGGPAAGP